LRVERGYTSKRVFGSFRHNDPLHILRGTGAGPLDAPDRRHQDDVQSFVAMVAERGGSRRDKHRDVIADVS
jgi:hypothetical protein